MRHFAYVACLAVLGALPCLAQSTVTLPDTSQTTTLTANVAEQVKITVPAGITFNVNDVASNTPAAAATVTLQNVVLASATKQLKISLQAGAAAFTPPVALATTWSATDVSWNAAAWTNGTGAGNTLASDSYKEVATLDADVASGSTNALVFTLAAKNTVKRSGNHTLSITWKVESIQL